MCDTHYRQNRSTGPGGVAPMDGTVYKLRLRRPNGNQPMYYSDRKKAFDRARQEAQRGDLLYFSCYGGPVNLLDEV